MEPLQCPRLGCQSRPKVRPPSARAPLGLPFPMAEAGGGDVPANEAAPSQWPRLPLGQTVLGSAAGDIVLQGAGVAPRHCVIENVRGTLALHPCGNPCAIDGLAVTRPTRLSQGKEGSLAGPGRGRNCKPLVLWLCSLRLHMPQTRSGMELGGRAGQGRAVGIGAKE